MSASSSTEKRNRWQVFAASATASLISTTVMNPLEVAKLNMQYFPLSCPRYPHRNYRQMFACGCTKFSFEGSVKTLRLAIPQSLFTSIIFMQIYEPSRRFVLEHTSLGMTLSTIATSIFSRLVVVSGNIPFESLRIRMSNRVKDNKINFVGYRVTVVRDMIYSAIFWSSFETYRNMMTQGDYRNNMSEVKDFTWRNFILNMLPAFLFGASTSALTTPLDTLKTRIQSQSLKKYQIWKGLKSIYFKQGMAGLFSGIEWRIIKNGGHTALYMYIYEWMIKNVAIKDIQAAQNSSQI